MRASSGETGKLVVVATPIGNLEDITFRAVRVLREADVVVAEDTRKTRGLLTYLGITGKRLVSLHAHNEVDRVPHLIDLLKQDKMVALVSDAGTPGISDPGSHLVAACMRAGLEVTAVPGPSALSTAISLSGFGGGRFLFEGFLPRKGKERRERLHELGIVTEMPVILFEAPHHLGSTLADLMEVCGEERQVFIARELTKVYEELWLGSLGEALSAPLVDQPRGEYVIVLGPRHQEHTTISEEELLVFLEQLMAKGGSRRDLATAASKKLGLSRNKVYAVLNQLHGTTSPPADVPTAGHQCPPVA
jgi:16S rRNA (cytidine1402-2'-O)-methyltransferase